MERRTRAQRAPRRLVRRAQISQLAAHGRRAPAIAQQLGVSETAVGQRLARCAVEGLAGRAAAPRAGRPRTYTDAVYRQVGATARGRPPKPAAGAVPPPCHWTLDRLPAERAKAGLPSKRRPIRRRPIRRRPIRRRLPAEHLTWQKPRTWLARTHATCAEKRGRPSASPALRPLAAP
jgi:transposase